MAAPARQPAHPYDTSWDRTVQPDVVYNARFPPKYPVSAWLAGKSGTVYLVVRVDRQGVIEQVDVERSSGYPSLDRAAVETVKQWHFKSAILNGFATTGYVRVPVDFDMPAFKKKSRWITNQ